MRLLQKLTIPILGFLELWAPRLDHSGPWIEAPFVLLLLLQSNSDGVEAFPFKECADIVLSTGGTSSGKPDLWGPWSQELHANGQVG